MKTFDRINPDLFNPSPEIALSPDGHPGYTPAIHLTGVVKARSTDQPRASRARITK